MRWFIRILIVIAITVAAFTFAVKNQTLVDVNFWDAFNVSQIQLGYALVTAFGIGLILGYIGILLTRASASMKAGTINRKLKKTEAELAKAKETIEKNSPKTA